MAATHVCVARDCSVPASLSSATLGCSDYCERHCKKIANILLDSGVSSITFAVPAKAGILEYNLPFTMTVFIAPDISESHVELVTDTKYVVRGMNYARIVEDLRSVMDNSKELEKILAFASEHGVVEPWTRESMANFLCSAFAQLPVVQYFVRGKQGTMRRRKDERIPILSAKLYPRQMEEEELLDLLGNSITLEEVEERNRALEEMKISILRKREERRRPEMEREEKERRAREILLREEIERKERKQRELEESKMKNFIFYRKGDLRMVPDRAFVLSDLDSIDEYKDYYENKLPRNVSNAYHMVYDSGKFWVLQPKWGLGGTKEPVLNSVEDVCRIIGYDKLFSSGGRGTKTEAGVGKKRCGDKFYSKEELPERY